jgi:hypothetical protein
MTFLNPFLLFGLVAASIPIILHLLNLRKLKTVEFSSLQFLKELQKTTMRRVKIRQWLLLLLRTLLIILVVLAFARPALRGTAGTMTGHARSTIVILLDDSPSMAVRDENGVMFRQATAAVTNLLSLVRDDDELHFLRLSEIRHAQTFPPLSVATVREELGKATPSLESVPFREAFGVAAKILSESRNFNQEFHIITDAQATQFITQGTRDSSDLFEERVKIFLIEAGKDQDNAGVTAIESKTQILARGKPVSLTATVRNFGNSALRNSIMSVYLDGARVVQQSIDATPFGSATSGFTVTPKRRGMIEGYTQLEDDALDADGKRFFVLDVPERISVLLVGASSKETRLPNLALTLGGDSSLAGVMAVTQITQSQLSSVDITKYDVLLLCGVREFSPTDADRIAQFVQAGGGVALFPGDESQLTNWNATLLPKLNLPAIQGPTGSTTGAESFLSFEKIDTDHPLFGGLFESPAAGASAQPHIESPRVFRAIKPHPSSAAHTIISLSDGSGFLTEYAFGSGRILLWSVEAGTEWSDFPVKGLFAPLLHRSVAFLAGSRNSTSTGMVGDPIKASLRLSAGAGGEPMVFRSPSGMEERTAPTTRTATGLSIATSSPTTEAGVYTLRRGQEILYAAAINVEPNESDLRHVSGENLATFLHTIGIEESQVQRLKMSDKLEASVLESRLGIELWKYLLAAAVVIALAEMAVARESRSPRSVPEPVT